MRGHLSALEFEVPQQLRVRDVMSVHPRCHRRCQLCR
jgi:hypothetical protein